MSTLQNLRSEKKLLNGFASDIKNLENRLAESLSEPEKLVATKQDTEDSVAAKSATEKGVPELKREAESTARVHAQSLQARNSKMNKLKKLVPSSEK